MDVFTFKSITFRRTFILLEALRHQFDRVQILHVLPRIILSYCECVLPFHVFHSRSSLCKLVASLAKAGIVLQHTFQGRPSLPFHLIRYILAGCMYLLTPSLAARKYTHYALTMYRASHTILH